MFAAGTFCGMHADYARKAKYVLTFGAFYIDARLSVFRAIAAKRHALFYGGSHLEIFFVFGAAL